MEICKVSEIDYAKGLIKVEFPAKDNIVSNWITFPAHEYEMPEVGDLVKVEFEPDAYGNPYTSGICYQKCFNKDELPKMQGKDIFYKTMKGDLILIYDRVKKELIIQTEKNIILKGVEKIQLEGKQIILKAADQVQVQANAVQIEAANISLTGQLSVNGQTSISGETSIDGNLSVSGIVSAQNI